MMRVLVILLLAATLARPSVGLAATPGTSLIVLADFDHETPAAFPAGWKSRDDAAAMRIYRVRNEEGDRYLHAVAQAEAAQIGLPVSFDVRDYPVLSWRWRVVELPAGGNERQARTNDSAAGVYAVFRGSFGGLLPRVIKYVWSAAEPRGATFTSPGYANAHIVVLASGREGAGAWRTETVNVAEDYRRLFRAEPPELQGIAILTDADDTGTRAAADYDDFHALSASEPAAGAGQALSLAP